MNPINPLTLKRTLIILAFVVLFATIVPPLTTMAAPPAQGTTVYYVRFGDTLFSIARRFNTTVPAIMAANNLTSDFIFAGQRLNIPTGQTNVTVTPGTPTATPTGTITPATTTPGPFTCSYTVQYRDTLFSIAWRYHTTVGALMQANYLYYPLIYVNQQLTVPCVDPVPAPWQTYTVQQGDTLFHIAVLNGTSVYALAIVNGLYNPNLIYAGQKIVIPYPGTVTYPTPAATTTPGAGTPTVTPTPTVTTTGTSGGGSVCPATTCAVIIRNLAFEPPTLTINRGTIVTWLNLDTVNHTLVSGTPGSPSNVFTSPAIGPNQNYTFTFPNPGTYKYYDQDQGANLTGTIIVQ